MAYLEIETQEGVRRVSLDRERLSIGRLSYNDVVLPYAQISRQHAELRNINGQWWIADLHSTNGLQLDSRRIQEHALANGDRIVLAPGISVRFVEDAAMGSQPGAQPWDGMPAGGAVWDRPAQVSQPFPPQPAGGGGGLDAPFVPPSSVAPLRPRSVFSDDELPYVPPSMAGPSSPSMPAGQGAVELSRRTEGPRATPPAVPGSATGGVDGGGFRPSQGGQSGSTDSYDPYRRSGPAGERQRISGGPAAKLLHVCQTCGQLTSPDAVYCQNCRNSIAHECAQCGLSLLPIQDRCPRCHTPNAASVRRARPGHSDL